MTVFTILGALLLLAAFAGVINYFFNRKALKDLAAKIEELLNK